MQYVRFRAGAVRRGILDRGDIRAVVWVDGAPDAGSSRWITLRPGDVVLTASPGGVGSMRAGDTVTVHIDQIGELANQVVTRPLPSPQPASADEAGVAE